MIVGIGIDSVEIARFIHWYAFEKKKLQRIFSAEEIHYCLANRELSSQRFAVRFAAREALFKALTVGFPNHRIPFLTLCGATTIIKKRAPELSISWQRLESYQIKKPPSLAIHLSLTHTKTIATALVILA